MADIFAIVVKVANIMAEIAFHSSFYPFIWCFARADEIDQRGALRTMEINKNLEINEENWLEKREYQILQELHK